MTRGNNVASVALPPPGSLLGGLQASPAIPVAGNSHGRPYGHSVTAGDCCPGSVRPAVAAGSAAEKAGAGAGAGSSHASARIEQAAVVRILAALGAGQTLSTAAPRPHSAEWLRGTSVLRQPLPT